MPMQSLARLWETLAGVLRWITARRPIVVYVVVVAQDRLSETVASDLVEQLAERVAQKLKTIE